MPGYMHAWSESSHYCSKVAILGGFEKEYLSKRIRSQDLERTISKNTKLSFLVPMQFLQVEVVERIC